MKVHPMIRKFDVPASVTRSRSFLPCQCIARNAAAIRVPSGLRLLVKIRQPEFNWVPDTEWNAAGLYPVERSEPSGAELLDILCGARSGLAQHFSL